MPSIVLPKICEIRDDFCYLEDIKHHIYVNYMQQSSKLEAYISNNEPLLEAIGLPDGREGRAYFPQGLPAFTEVACGKVAFVGFIGQTRLPRTPDVKTKLWQIDTELLRDLCKNTGVLAYVSVSRSKKNSNWGNLVIFNTLQSINNWKNSQVHVCAVRDIAPYCYMDVRIHSGILPSGLSSSRFILYKTLFLDYETSGSKTNSKPRIVSRAEKYWFSQDIDKSEVLIDCIDDIEQICAKN